MILTKITTACLTAILLNCCAICAETFNKKSSVLSHVDKFILENHIITDQFLELTASESCFTPVAKDIFNTDNDDFIVSWIDYNGANKELSTTRFIKPDNDIFKELSGELSFENGCLFTTLDTLNILLTIKKANDSAAVFGKWTVQEFIDAKLTSEKTFILKNDGFKITQHPIIDTTDKSFLLCNPPEAEDIRNKFVNTDEMAAIYVEWDNLDKESILKIEWIRPDQVAHQLSTTNMPFFNGCITDFIEIKDKPPSMFPGQWFINVFKDDKFLFTDVFEILQISSTSPTPRPPTPMPTTTPTPAPTPAPIPAPTPISTAPLSPASAPFTIECEQFSLDSAELKELTLSRGETESCTAKLSRVDTSTKIKIFVSIKSGIRSSVRISPLSAAFDEKGKAKFIITGIRRGIDLVMWGIQDENGQLNFDKAAIEKGITLGMFIEVGNTF